MPHPNRPYSRLVFVCLVCLSHCTPVYEVIDMVASSRPCKHTMNFCIMLDCTVLYYNFYRFVLSYNVCYVLLYCTALYNNVSCFVLYYIALPYRWLEPTDFVNPL